MHKMTLMQYKKMWDSILKFKAENNNNTLPESVDVSSFKIGLDSIEQAVYLDMEQRVNTWKKSHEGQMPQIIGVEGPATGTEPQPPKGSVKTRLERGLGNFSNFTGFWQKIIGRGYKHYYNSNYTTEQTVSRVLNKEGVNCVDSMQLCYLLAREMGYEAKYVHVTCKEGGHIRGQIHGHEFKDWTRIDPAAALSVHTRAPIGKVWCDYPNARIEYAKWLRRT